jgi:hypothetical protein
VSDNLVSDCVVSLLIRLVSNAVPETVQFKCALFLQLVTRSAFIGDVSSALGMFLDLCNELPP